MRRRLVFTIGFRIELGEIETQLQKVEGIRKTTVFARENVSGEKQLCAYYEADCELPAAELKSVLSQELPAYMIPTYLIQLERLPLTTNGKVDRRSLPAPEESLQPGEGHTPPRTPLEANWINLEGHGRESIMA